MANLPGVQFSLTGASGSQGLLSPKGSWRAYVFPRGANASQDSTGTLITFDSAAIASRFTSLNWVQVGLSTANIRQVTGVGGNSISVNTAVTVSENGRIFLIGNTEPTVSGGSATYTTPNTLVRQRGDDTADLYANSMITTDSNGLVQFYAAPSMYDVMIQDGNRANQGHIADLEVGTVEGVSVIDAAIFGATVTFLAGVSFNGVATFGATVSIPGALGSTASLNQGPIDLRSLGLVNVKSWGARGDSSTNDTVGISLAMTHAYGNSLAGLYFPPGIYLASQIVIKQNMSLIGVGTADLPHGQGTRLQQISGSNSDFIVTDSALAASSPQHQSKISDMTIRGNTTDTSGSGIKFNSRAGENVRLERLTVRNFAESGIEISTGPQGGVVFEQIQATNNELYGIDVNVSGQPFRRISMYDISGDDNGQALIRCRTGSGTGGGESISLHGVKAEKATTGRQNYAVLLDDMNGTAVSVIGVAAENSSGQSATAAIGITNSSCRLTWSACDTQSSGGAYAAIVQDLVNGVTYTGAVAQFGCLGGGTLHAWRYGAALVSNLTIASGVITVTGTNHRVDTEAAAASDDLDTINGGIPGQILVLRAVSGARTVVVKHATGNIQVSGVTDFSLDNANDTATLFFDGTNWLSLATASNGA